jgi:hypothetical protein
MALYKLTERQVGFKFNQPTKALAAHGHISPINLVIWADDTARIFGLGVLCETQALCTEAAQRPLKSIRKPN